MGNKADLRLERKVPLAMAKEFAKEVDIRYVESSAKDARGVQKVFHGVARALT